jgi:alpha-ketoglutarate-dependent 2,4-dichlorophenoxyacetate dioxygenase
MTIGIRQIGPTFAGEVSGVDITRSIGRDEVAAIEAGMDRYAVLVFREQRLTDETQLAFTLNFGDLEHTRGNAITKPEEMRLDPAFADVSNLDRNHRPLARDSRRRLYALGNRLWHSDSSFRAVPATYSLLSGRIVVDKGGETEFADLRAAYDALDAATNTNPPKH